MVHPSIGRLVNGQVDQSLAVDQSLPEIVKVKYRLSFWRTVHLSKDNRSRDRGRNVEYGLKD
ncbi:hypothetical protein HAX54_051470, partial [Datura stramonium]|nr:hypothetical protein [Datura stramonium]